MKFHIIAWRWGSVGSGYPVTLVNGITCSPVDWQIFTTFFSSDASKANIHCVTFNCTFLKYLKRKPMLVQLLISSSCEAARMWSNDKSLNFMNHTSRFWASPSLDTSYQTLGGPCGGPKVARNDDALNYCSQPISSLQASRSLSMTQLTRLHSPETLSPISRKKQIKLRTHNAVHTLIAIAWAFISSAMPTQSHGSQDV